jgi:hypothetical protein
MSILRYRRQAGRPRTQPDVGFTKFKEAHFETFDWIGLATSGST